MGRVIFVAGLPGAGKSMYAAQLAGALDAEHIDDFKAGAINDNPNFNFSRHFQTLISGLIAGRTFIVADIDFCVRQSRKQAEYCVRSLVPDAHIEWHCFENDPDQCSANVVNRAAETKRDLAAELELIRFYASRYDVPEGAVVISVWRPSNG